MRRSTSGVVTVALARSGSLFLLWAAIGFVASWLILYGFTPGGPLILGVALLGYVVAVRLGERRLPEAFGALAGFGAFCLVLANATEGDPTPFAAVGAGAVAVGIGLYLVVGSRRCRCRIWGST